MILVIGHSHTGCLQLAAAEIDPAPIRTLNLNLLEKDGKLLRPEEGYIDPASLRLGRPRAVCLSLSGNCHNVLGLFEHPQKYAIGQAGTGAAPDEPGRWFIPHAVMQATMDFRAAAFAAMAAALYDHFPDARRIYLNAPPPFGDRTHVERHPGKLGGENPPPVAPDDLRMTLYRMQTDSYRRIAEKLGAAFVTPAPETLDDRGFLASGFYAADPTHGNAAYGKVMLDAILRQAEAA